MSKTRIVFCRIGYMTYYAGPQPGDEKPVGGGKYNKSKIGHEVWNFEPIKGRLYGYLEPYVKKDTNVETNINLERIDPSVTGDALSSVLVVFIARRPRGGQVVVGWYKNAKVFRTKKEHAKGNGRDGYYYYITARTRDCILLPTNRRMLEIPDGPNTPGRANIFYLLNNKGKSSFPNGKEPSWIKAIRLFIPQYNGPNLIDDADSELEEDIALLHENSGRAGGQGLNLNKVDRKLIEQHAMDRALAFFGQKAEDVSKTQSYDIHMNLGSHHCFIEVKGTQTNGNEVILTKNEVKFMKQALKNGYDTILFVVFNISLKGRGKNRRAYGGKERIIQPFDIRDTSLTPLSYKYTL